MRYKEFVAWCEDRSADGCWGLDAAMFCIDIIRVIEGLPFWKREKKWRELNDEYKIKTKIVDPINQKIQKISK